MIKFTIRQTLTRWAWALILIFLIAISSSSFIVLGSISDGLGRTQAEYAHYNLGFVIVYDSSPLYLTQDLFSYDQIGYPFTEESVDKVLSIDGVQAVYRVTVVLIGYKLDTGDYYDLGLIGIDTEASRDAVLPYANMMNGRFLSKEDTGCAVINFKLSELMPTTTNMTLNILGRKTTLRIIGVYNSLLPQEIDPLRSVLVDQYTFWQMVNTSRRKYSSILLSVKDPSRVEGVVSKLREEFPGASVIYQYDLAQHTVSLMSSTSILYGTINALVNAVAAATVVLLRVLDLTKRKRELGLLMAVGWSEGSIINYLFIQSLFLGLSGAAIGITASCAAGMYVTSLLTPMELTKTGTSIRLGLNPSYFPYAVSLAISFSIIAFVATYLCYRRLTPLRMLEET